MITRLQMEAVDHPANECVNLSTHKHIFKDSTTTKNSAECYCRGNLLLLFPWQISLYIASPKYYLNGLTAQVFQLEEQCGLAPA